MRRDEALRIMTFGLRVGEAMLESNVAVSDVQDTVRRITSAFGMERCEVSITLDVITMNFMHPSLEVPITLMRVVRVGEPRLDRLVALEDLSRRVQSGELDLRAASKEIEAFDDLETRHPRVVTSAAALVSVAGWVLFAGGGWIGASAAVLAGLVREVIAGPLARSRAPAVFSVFLAAVVAVAVPNVFAAAGFAIALLPATVGGIFPLLPGGLLVASVTDGLSGSPLSSLAKGLEAAVVATAVALATLATLAVASRFDVESPTAPSTVGTVAAALFAGMAVAGLAASRSMPARFIAPTAVLAIVSWSANRAVTTAGYDALLGAFLAAVLIGLGGQLMARVQRTTATVHATSAIYVLVPGFSFYLAMSAFARGDSDSGVAALVDAVGRAGAIAAGVALGVAFGRSVQPPRPRVALWRRTAYRRERPAPVSARRTRRGTGAA